MKFMTSRGFPSLGTLLVSTCQAGGGQCRAVFDLVVVIGDRAKDEPDRIQDPEDLQVAKRGLVIADDRDNRRPHSGAARFRMAGDMGDGRGVGTLVLGGPLSKDRWEDLGWTADDPRPRSDRAAPALRSRRWGITFRL